MKDKKAVLLNRARALKNEGRLPEYVRDTLMYQERASHKEVEEVLRELGGVHMVEVDEIVEGCGRQYFWREEWKE